MAFLQTSLFSLTCCRRTDETFTFHRVRLITPNLLNHGQIDLRCRYKRTIYFFTLFTAMWLHYADKICYFVKTILRDHFKYHHFKLSVPRKNWIFESILHGTLVLIHSLEVLLKLKITFSFHNIEQVYGHVEELLFHCFVAIQNPELELDIQT